MQVLYSGFQWRWFLFSTLSTYFIFTPYHDAAHRAVGRRSRNSNGSILLSTVGNEIVGQLCGVPLLAPFTVFRHIHLLHHKYTNDPERDPDMHAQAGGVFHWLTIELSYYVYMVKHARETPRHVLFIGITNQLLNVLGMIYLSKTFGFRSVLFGILVPQRLAIGILAYCLDYVPHRGAKEQGIGYQTTKHVTRFFRGETVLSAFKKRLLAVILMAQDVHVIHHLYPQVPFYNYHAVWNKHEKELYKLGVEQTSLFY